MLLAQGDDDSVVGGGRLQLEIKGAAKTLAERETPGAIDARAEGGVEDELHAAALIEETLRHNRVARRKRAERGMPFPHVFHGLIRAAAIEPALRRQPLRGIVSAPRDLLAKRRYFLRQLDGAAGSFAAPEGNPRGRAVRIFDAHSAGLDAAYAPGGGTEQEDVAGQALHGEILIHGPDGCALGFGHYEVIGGVRNRSAGGDGGKASASPTAQAAIDGVAMQVCAACVRAPC